MHLPASTARCAVCFGYGTHVNRLEACEIPPKFCIAPPLATSLSDKSVVISRQARSPVLAVFCADRSTEGRTLWRKQTPALNLNIRPGAIRSAWLEGKIPARRYT